MRSGALWAAIAIAGIGCKKPEPPPPEPEPEPEPSRQRPEAILDAAAIPPPPPQGEVSGQTTPWGELVPGDHEHPEGTPVTVFDIGDRIYDLSLRGLPAINDAGDVAYASSVPVADLDYSTLAVVIDRARGRDEVLTIFDAVADGGARGEPIPIEDVRRRARAANLRLARDRWRPMIALESVGELRGGAEQKLVSVDRTLAATFAEPVLTIRSREATSIIDGGAWSNDRCAAAGKTGGAVLLSGVWFDPPTGALVARVGYEGTASCTVDPIFAVVRGR